MRGSTQLVLLIILFCNVTIVFAESRYGATVSLSDIDLSDDIGAVRKNDLVSLTAISTQLFSRNNKDIRYWHELSYQKFENSANGALNQTTRSLSLDTQLQASLSLSKWFRPYVGAGGGFSFNDYLERYDTSPSGFLTKKYDDKNFWGVHSVFAIGFSLKRIRPGWYLGGTYSYKASLGDGLNEQRLSIYFLI